MRHQHQAGAGGEAPSIDVAHKVVHEHRDAVINVCTGLAIGEPGGRGREQEAAGQSQ
jgi:hypothetical protein